VGRGFRCRPPFAFLPFLEPPSSSFAPHRGGSLGPSGHCQPRPAAPARRAAAVDGSGAEVRRPEPTPLRRCPSPFPFSWRRRWPEDPKVRLPPWPADTRRWGRREGGLRLSCWRELVAKNKTIFFRAQGHLLLSHQLKGRLFCLVPLVKTPDFQAHPKLSFSKLTQFTLYSYFMLRSLWGHISRLSSIFKSIKKVLGNKNSIW
jgi:hypothetical protein